jgi:tRNA dimethylallyltransferase
MEKLVVIVGPTAVGKTALSLALAEKFNGEIVSGDSMQVYRGLDIGTAKATAAEQARAPHHMIDIVDPDETYSAAQFVATAREAISDISARGKLPILVGGTGFYVQALLGDRPLADVDDVSDPEFVETWTQRARDEGEEVLREALRQVDPVSADRIQTGAIRRLVRALLVSEKTGRPFSEQQPEAKRLYDALVIGLTTSRELLYARINDRVDQMVAEGLLDEVAEVVGLPDDSTAKKAIGYKELFSVVAGEEPLAAGVEKLKQASRRYAKRQMTWFNNQFADVRWFDLVQVPADVNRVADDVKKFMSE